jgi:hypothetical protein
MLGTLTNPIYGSVCGTELSALAKMLDAWFVKVTVYTTSLNHPLAIPELPLACTTHPLLSKTVTRYIARARVRTRMCELLITGRTAGSLSCWVQYEFN